MKTCDHVSSRDKKKEKQAGSNFVMQAGLRNNEFCLHGYLTATQRKVCKVVAMISHFSTSFTADHHHLGPSH